MYSIINFIIIGFVNYDAISKSTKMEANNNFAKNKPKLIIKYTSKHEKESCP